MKVAEMADCWAERLAAAKVVDLVGRMVPKWVAVMEYRMAEM